MKLCDTFFLTSRQFYIYSWLQNFGFSEHPRKLPKGLRRVITESAVPIGKAARSQYVDFHTSCESPHNNPGKLGAVHTRGPDGKIRTAGARGISQSDLRI